MNRKSKSLSQGLGRRKKTSTILSWSILCVCSVGWRIGKAKCQRSSSMAAAYYRKGRPKSIWIIRGSFNSHYLTFQQCIAGSSYRIYHASIKISWTKPGFPTTTTPPYTILVVVVVVAAAGEMGWYCVQGVPWKEIVEPFKWRYCEIPTVFGESIPRIWTNDTSNTSLHDAKGSWGWRARQIKFKSNYKLQKWMSF
jgi:hypothetical protein